MKDLLTKILNNLNCNSSYCQEYEYNVIPKILVLGNYM